MFVINLTKKDLVFRAHGEVLILKSGLNKVDGKIFNAGELKNHFGCNVAFITDKDAEEIKGDKEAPKPIAPKVEEKKEEIIKDEISEEEIVEEDKPAEEIVEDETSEDNKLEEKQEVKAEKQNTKSNKAGKAKAHKSNKK